MTLTICGSVRFVILVSANERRETGKFSKWKGNFRVSRRSAPQFSNRFFVKLLFQFDFQPKFPDIFCEMVRSLGVLKWVTLGKRTRLSDYWTRFLCMLYCWACAYGWPNAYALTPQWPANCLCLQKKAFDILYQNASIENTDKAFMKQAYMLLVMPV